MSDDKLNLIYIVEPKDVPSYVPNFTVPNAGSAAEAAWNAEVKVGGAPAIAVAALAVPVLGLPATLLAAAASASPAVARLFAKDKEQLPKDLNDAESSEIEAFMRKHALSVKMGEDAGFVFPPGHPQVGQVYRRHPLADMRGAGKDDIYIPSDKYDELLLEEREAELLKLLVHLGATRVSITRKQNAGRTVKRRIAAAGGIKAVAEAESSASSDISQHSDSFDTRDFELTGKAWKFGDKLDRTLFAWIPFEPSWNALIEAREVGGCTKATLEVCERTSYSSDRSLALKIQAKLYGASGSVGLLEDAEEEKILVIKADFGPLVQQTDSHALSNASAARANSSSMHKRDAGGTRQDSGGGVAVLSTEGA